MFCVGPFYLSLPVGLDYVFMYIHAISRCDSIHRGCQIAPTSDDAVKKLGPDIVVQLSYSNTLLVLLFQVVYPTSGTFRRWISTEFHSFASCLD